MLSSKGSIRVLEMKEALDDEDDPRRVPAKVVVIGAGADTTARALPREPSGFACGDVRVRSIDDQHDHLQELFYVSERLDLVSMSVDTASGPSFGRREPLDVTARFIGARNGRNYDITPDGRKFLVVRDALAAETSEAPRVHIVQNWREELKRLVPTSN